MNYKTLLLKFTLLFLVLNAQGQETESLNENFDTTEVNLKNTLVLIIDKSEQVTVEGDTVDLEDDDEDEYKHWSGMYIGFNALINDKNSIAHPGGFPLLELNHARSTQAQINFFEKQFELGSPHVKFITGLGFMVNNISFEKSTLLQPGQDSVVAINSGLNYSRNTLYSGGFTVPVLLGFNTHKGEKGVHLTIGAVGSVNAWINTQQKYFLNGEKHVVQINNDFNLNRWNVSALANLGFGDWLTLYAQYQINPYFEKNALNPTANLATVGLRLFPF